MTEIEIRSDWAAALVNNRDNIGEISGTIEWGFSYQDLFVLTCLHEMDFERELIEDLLEDCNFHKVCRLLSKHEYDECRKVIAQDFREDMWIIPQF